MKSPLSKTQRRGFTLIELLVAMAITTLIVSVLVTVTSAALDVYNRSRSEVRAASQGRAMIDTIARDFESMIVKEGDDSEWLYALSDATKPGPNGVISPNSIDLTFLTAVTDRYEGQVGSATDLGGNISTVAYELSYQDPIAAQDTAEYKSMVLYRKLIDPDTTFANILGTADISGSVPDVSDVENFICENIYQFTLTFYVDVAATVAEGLRPRSSLFPCRLLEV